MSLSERRSPYFWVTWLTGLLAGEKHCEWAAWLKGHYYYEEIDDEGKKNRTAQFKADHAVLVAEHAMLLRADGWRVTVEAQNKFNYRGQAATVGGAPDVIATRAGQLRVDDLKGGKSRDEHFWQVAIYGMLLPLVNEAFSELVISGNVVYRDTVRAVSPEQMVTARPNIVAKIKKLAAPAVPLRTPSVSECGFCNIANCPERIAGTEEAMSGEGDAF